tara:strand:+ start:98 stop:346 length:249 start_codon:yes stop_codon:yes gene_type:complete
MEGSKAFSSDSFLSIHPGDLVVVEEKSFSSDVESFWMGHVIHATCGARSCRKNSLFQVADLDTGSIKTINADLVKGVLRPNT